MNARLWAALAGGVLALCASPLAAEEVESVLNGGDPFVLVAGGQAWIYPTTGGDRLESWSSDDLKTWQGHGPLVRLGDIRWAADDHAPKHSPWAPDMLAARGRYYLYYSLGPQNPTPSRLGVAICDRPSGPCIDSGRPLLTGGNGFEAIDPMVFAQPKTGRTYLYAGGSAGAKLRVFLLKRDLITIDHEIPVEQPPAFTEGAFMHERNGVYYLSYSHGKWNDATYSVHYATAATPVGPWRYQGIILQSDGKYKGPGHHSFFKDPRTGAWMIAYHRWEAKEDNGPYRGSRRVAIQPISYDKDGRILPVRMTD